MTLVQTVTEIPQHIFISYSRHDSEFAHNVAFKLRQAGLPVWIDSDDLSPGTPNWESAIRSAIENAFAVVLIASPDSGKSVYVQAELQLANNFERAIYPLWVEGDVWAQCIPLNMINYQYIDCRDSNRYAGTYKIRITMIDHIKQFFGKSFAVPHGTKVPYKLLIDLDYLSILEPRSQTHYYLDLKHYHTIKDILDEVFTMGLGNYCLPYTYGKEWVLACIPPGDLAQQDSTNSSNFVLLMPFEEIFPKTEPFSQRSLEWMTTSFSDWTSNTWISTKPLGLVIIDRLDELEIFGLFTGNQLFFNQIRQGSSKARFAVLHAATALFEALKQGITHIDYPTMMYTARVRLLDKKYLNALNSRGFGLVFGCRKPTPFASDFLADKVLLIGDLPIIDKSVHD